MQSEIIVIVYTGGDKTGVCVSSLTLKNQEQSSFVSRNSWFTIVKKVLLTVCLVRYLQQNYCIPRRKIFATSIITEHKRDAKSSHSKNQIAILSLSKFSARACGNVVLQFLWKGCVEPLIRIS